MIPEHEIETHAVYLVEIGLDLQSFLAVSNRARDMIRDRAVRLTCPTDDDEPF